MADKLKQIKEFPNKPDFGDEDLLLIQGAGVTYNVTGNAVKKYAEDAAKPQVELAAAQAKAAEASAKASEAAAVRSETAVEHPPVLDVTTGFWQMWDRASGTYVPTELRGLGKDFTIKGYYPTFEALEAAVPNPEAGDTYGVGTEPPYEIYVWDAVSGTWKNNGTLLNSGDMTQSVYDPQKKREDIFAYADKAAAEAAKNAGVGQSMAGKTVEPTQGTTVTAGVGAEIFNDYRERTYGKDEGSAYTVTQTGNIASGLYAHAEGTCATAAGEASHAEGGRIPESGGCRASGYAAHAEGAGVIASGVAAHAEGRRTTASGENAHAEGVDATASGTAAHAEGRYTRATMPYAHAEGNFAKALEEAAHAEGSLTEASGPHSHAEGTSSKAKARSTHAEGASTEASGEAAHAEGNYSKATGAASHAEGSLTEASGPHSHAEGNSTIAKGYYSHAGGLGTIAAGIGQMAIGTYNVENSSAATALIIGSGTSSAKANCFRATVVGVYASGNYNASGADYAELFEWSDGNPEGMDRVGRFVTLDGTKIRLAGPGSDYILGIVSGAPSVVGDVYDDQWAGMFLTDIYGRPVWENVEVPEVTEERELPELVDTGKKDENGEPVFEERLVKETVTVSLAHTERRQKLNPNYDSTQKYVPRTERPEWASVGLLGKLVALEDGSCQVNGWCTVGEGGEATANGERTRFRCMEKLVDPDSGRKCVRIMILPGA